MIFIVANNEPTVILMLTEADCNDMRGGRTKFVDRSATKDRTFNKIVISLHKNQGEIEGILKSAGHEALLKNMPSPVPNTTDEVCSGCQGIMKAYLLLDGKCIACWRDLALVQERAKNRSQKETEKQND